MVPFTAMTDFGRLTIIQALGVLEDTGKLEGVRALLNQLVETVFGGDDFDVNDLELYYPVNSRRSSDSSGGEDESGSGAEGSRDEGGTEPDAANDTGRRGDVQSEDGEVTHDDEDVQKDVSGDTDETNDDDHPQLGGKKRSLSDGGKEDKQDMQNEEVTPAAPTPMDHNERSAHELPGPQKTLSESGESKQTPHKVPYCALCKNNIPKNTAYKNLEKGKGRVCLPCSRELGKGQGKGRQVKDKMESPSTVLGHRNLQSPKHAVPNPKPPRSSNMEAFSPMQLVPQRRSAGVASGLITSQLASRETSSQAFGAPLATSGSSVSLPTQSSMHHLTEYRGSMNFLTMTSEMELRWGYFRGRSRIISLET